MSPGVYGKSHQFLQDKLCSLYLSQVNTLRSSHKIVIKDLTH